MPHPQAASPTLFPGFALALTIAPAPTLARALTLALTIALARQVGSALGVALLRRLHLHHDSLVALPDAAALRSRGGGEVTFLAAAVHSRRVAAERLALGHLFFMLLCAPSAQAVKGDCGVGDSNGSGGAGDGNGGGGGGGEGGEATGVGDGRRRGCGPAACPNLRSGLSLLEALHAALLAPPRGLPPGCRPLLRWGRGSNPDPIPDPEPNPESNSSPSPVPTTFHHTTPIPHPRPVSRRLFRAAAMPWLEWLGRVTFLGDTHDAHGEFCAHQSRHAGAASGVHRCTAAGPGAPGAAEAMGAPGAQDASPKGGVPVTARMPAFVSSALGAAVDESVASVRLLRASAFFDLGAPDEAEADAEEEAEEEAEAEEAEEGKGAEGEGGGGWAREAAAAAGWTPRAVLVPRTPALLLAPDTPAAALWLPTTPRPRPAAAAAAAAATTSAVAAVEASASTGASRDPPERPPRLELAFSAAARRRVEAYWAAAWALQWARLGRKRAARLRAEERQQHAALARGAARQRKERDRQSRADAAATARRAAAVAARAAVRSGLDAQISERQIERQRAAEAEAEAWRAAAEAGEEVGALRRKAREALLERYAARDAPLENRLRLARWQLVRSERSTHSPFARHALSSLSAGALGWLSTSIANTPTTHRATPSWPCYPMM